MTTPSPELPPTQDWEALQQTLYEKRNFVKIQPSPADCLVIVESNKVFRPDQVVNADELTAIAKSHGWQSATLIQTDYAAVLVETCPLHPDNGIFFINTGDADLDLSLTRFQQYMLDIETSDPPVWLTGFENPK